MFDLLVDIHQLTETTVNGEPADVEGATPLHADVPACFLRLSGSERRSDGAAAVGLTHRLAIQVRARVSERSVVRNVRTREGADVPAQPDHYRVKYVSWSRRGDHLELDLEASL